MSHNAIAKGVVSRSLWCRWFGCISCVPARGYYRGMPQSHCYNCGAKTWGAADFCEDHVEPHDPRLIDRLFLWLTPKYDAWVAKRRVAKQLKNGV